MLNAKCKMLNAKSEASSKHQAIISRTTFILIAMKSLKFGHKGAKMHSLFGLGGELFFNFGSHYQSFTNCNEQMLSIFSEF